MCCTKSENAIAYTNDFILSLQHCAKRHRQKVSGHRTTGQGAMEGIISCAILFFISEEQCRFSVGAIIPS